MEEEKVYEKGFKAYEPGLVCRGKQYAEGETYEEAGGELCGAGMMHYCVNPFDVLNYYPLVTTKGEIIDFTAVEALAEPKKDETKSATKKLRIGVKLGLDGFIKACVDFLYEKTTKDIPTDKINSGDASQLAASGDASQLAASGRYSQLAASGDASTIICERDHAVVACAGKNAKVKGPVGTWFALSEYGEWDGEGYPCICMKAAQIDGENLKPDTWYTLKDGEFVEVNDADT